MKHNEILRRVLNPDERYRINLFKIKNAIKEHIIRDELTQHFLTYHFVNSTLFGVQFIDFVCLLDRLVPDTGIYIIKKIGEIRGAHISKYEQIIQMLCEVVIAKKFIEAFPPGSGFTFEWEPTDKTKKNPEFMVKCDTWRVLVEVKCPSLFDYEEKNRMARAQVVGRTPFMKDVLENLYGKQHVALPLDNKMKDFLVSAEAKFSSFNSINVPTYNLLFVCWSERMFEAITPVTGLGSGLFTERSFYQKNGDTVIFPSIGGVIITSHQHLLGLLLKEIELPPGVNGFDYGDYWVYGSSANPTFCHNPNAQTPIPEFLQEMLHTIPAGKALDPLAQEMDFIHWIR